MKQTYEFWCGSSGTRSKFIDKYIKCINTLVVNACVQHPALDSGSSSPELFPTVDSKLELECCYDQEVHPTTTSFF